MGNVTVVSTTRTETPRSAARAVGATPHVDASGNQVALIEVDDVGVRGPKGASGDKSLVETLPNPPADPQPGAMWWNAANGNTYIWYEDQDSAQWVQVNAGPAGSVVITPQMFNAVGDGVTDDTAAFAAIANIVADDIHLYIPPGDYVISAPVLFTDKNLHIEGGGVGVSRLRFTTQAATLKYLSTSTISEAEGFTRLDVSNLTIQKYHAVTPGNGGTAIEAQWSYPGIVFSWEHATFENLNIQGGPNVDRYWNVGIKLIDAGCCRFNNVRVDNGKADIANARAAVELVRQAASNIGQLQFVNCFLHRFTTGLLLTHAAAGPGTIEGIYITNQETVAVRHVIKDDVVSGTANQVNGVHYTNSHGQVSKCAFDFGWIANLYIKGCNLTFGVLGDSAAALECAIRARVSVQVMVVEGSRLIRAAPVAVPVFILPTRNDIDQVRIVGNSFGAWSEIVNQPTGTTTKDPARIFIGEDNQRGATPLSTTNSGYEPIQAHMLAQSAAPIVHTGTLSETTLVTISIQGGSMGPNGRLRVTTLWSFTNSANSKAFRVRLGGTQIWSRAEGASVSSQQVLDFANRGVANSQVINAGTSTGGMGATSAAVTATAIDTAATQSLTITAQHALASETITLESYTVELIRGYP